jgi:hypothetical protein
VMTGHDEENVVGHDASLPQLIVSKHTPQRRFVKQLAQGDEAGFKSLQSAAVKLFAIYVLHCINR